MSTWFFTVTDKQDTQSLLPSLEGDCRPRFGFRCQLLRGGCSDTSFKVAMQGRRMVFADRVKVGHAFKVGSLINLSRIDLHCALESH